MNAIGAWLFLLGFCASALADDAPKKIKPKFTISKETTFVTGPVDKDGYIDYSAALNERLGKGVTPDNNANVLIWKALGARPEGKPMPPEFFKLMGMDEPPEKGEYFVTSYKFAKDNLKLDFAEQMKISEQLAQAMRCPWAKDDFPHLAAWLKANEKPLDMVKEAAKRTHYFSPLVPTKSEKGSADLVGALTPSLMKCRDMANAFTCRAMLRLSLGRDNDAWDDLLVCHRLGRHVGLEGMFIDSVVGIAIDTIAVRSELAFLEHAKADATFIQKHLSDLQRLPALPNIADNVDVGERLFILGYTIDLARKGVSGVETMLLLEEGEFDKALERELEKKKPDKKIELLLDDVDWDPALRQINKLCDRMAAVLREPERIKREGNLKKLDQEFDELKKVRPTANDLVKTLVAIKSDPAAKTELIRRLFGCPADTARNVQQAADRAEQTQRNLHIAFALAAHQREHGKYPEKLDALAPKYLAKIPNDYFTGKPLVYRPNDKGYLLYSFGPNGKDDEGRGREDAVLCDDISVRMPMPKHAKK